VNPAKDPNSPKYRDDPSRYWRGGRWSTKEQIERNRKANRERYRDDAEWLELRRRRYREDPVSREQQRERSLDYYWNLSGFQYNRRLLRSRRRRGLQRMAERNSR
jgi:hypothetical protein